VYYYHFDGLGSVVALSDVNSVLVERYTYDVFGRPAIRDANGTEIAESAFANPYLFTGRAYDAETGLYYYRARYYDYATGRFLQADPTGYIDGLNLYTYCTNNPLRFVDPLGLSWKSLALNTLRGAAGGALTGAIAGAIGGLMVGGPAGALAGLGTGLVYGAGKGALAGALTAFAADAMLQAGGAEGLSPSQAFIAGGLGGLAAGAVGGISAVEGSTASQVMRGSMIAGAVAGGTSGGIASNGDPRVIAFGIILGGLGGAGTAYLAEQEELRFYLMSFVMSADCYLVGNDMEQLINFFQPPKGCN
jgi:RHS repeat-associated protein